MASIGRINHLIVTKTEATGAYLDAAELGEVFLPKSYVPDNCQAGDEMDVFIFLDSQERLTATTQKVKAQVGEVAYLEVVQVNQVGAFLDCGLAKDILVPFNQQPVPMLEGKSYLVFVFLDENSHRIIASAKLNKFINHGASIYKTGQAVELMIADITHIGYSAVINHLHWGVLFFSDVVKPLKVGQKLNGFIKNIRDDGKIDLSLQASGYAKVDSLSVKILKQLEKNNGFMPISDKSPAEMIYEQFATSKKSFKMTIGALYKKRLITITKEGIRLVQKGKTQ